MIVIQWIHGKREWNGLTHSLPNTGNADLHIFAKSSSSSLMTCLIHAESRNQDLAGRSQSDTDESWERVWHFLSIPEADCPAITCSHKLKINTHQQKERHWQWEDFHCFPLKRNVFEIMIVDVREKAVEIGLTQRNISSITLVIMIHYISRSRENE